mmetsp:Transcript_10297/g.19764  ORF Transcript_10297/g.19764 Transcript_10297/m.19764 type:complete len:235 (-) Transcript_10297:1546-2250(-)
MQQVICRGGGELFLVSFDCFSNVVLLLEPTPFVVSACCVGCIDSVFASDVPLADSVVRFDGSSNLVLTAHIKSTVNVVVCCVVELPNEASNVVAIGMLVSIEPISDEPSSVDSPEPSTAYASMVVFGGTFRIEVDVASSSSFASSSILSSFSSSLDALCSPCFWIHATIALNTSLKCLSFPYALSKIIKLRLSLRFVMSGPRENTSTLNLSSGSFAFRFASFIVRLSAGASAVK